MHYKEIREGKEHANKTETEWKEGIWLGHARGSNEVLVGTKDGVVRAYSIIRKAEGERWNADMVREMRGTPQQPDPARQGDAIPIRVKFDPPSTQQELATRPTRQKIVRRMRLEPYMFDNMSTQTIVRGVGSNRLVWKKEEGTTRDVAKG